MFESLGGKISGIIKDFAKKGRSIKQNDLDQTLQEIRVALIDSDVNFRVVAAINNIIKEKALGAKIFDSVSPGEMIIKISHDAIKAVLGDNSESEIELANKNKKAKQDKKEHDPSDYIKKFFNLNGEEKILLVGLQGSGKTTTCAKLGNYIKNVTKKSPLISSVDYYRPAARTQLKILCERNHLDYFEGEDDESKSSADRVIKTLKTKLDFSKKNSQYSCSIFDTAGRISIDDKMMDELVTIKKLINPTNIILVIDSMAGRSALDVAKQFDEKLKLTGLIFTKLDSDTKAGVILSIKQVLNLPIFFLCSGEKIDDIDEFIPDRIAQRILGMGDIVSLVEKASAVIPSDNSDALKEKAKKGQLDFSDVLEQFKFLKKLGGLPFISKFLPPEMVNNASISEEEIRKLEAIILAMTPKERSNPKIISNCSKKESLSRKNRIARGAGCFTKDGEPDIKLVEKLLQMHEKISHMAQQFAFFDKDSMKDKMKIGKSMKDLVK